MQRESKILLSTGFLLLFATVGWSVSDRTTDVPSAATAFLGSGDRLGGGAPLVGIVVSPEDCGSMIEQLRFWNQPYLAREARVRALLRYRGDTPEPLWKVVHGAGLAFPTRRADLPALWRMQQALGYTRGSFVAVFDSTGQVRMAVPLADLSDPRARASVLQFVRSLRPSTPAVSRR